MRKRVFGSKKDFLKSKKFAGGKSFVPKDTEIERHIDKIYHLFDEDLDEIEMKKRIKQITGVRSIDKVNKIYNKALEDYEYTFGIGGAMKFFDLAEKGAVHPLLHNNHGISNN